MPEKEKEEILERVQREFPSCKVLQDIHYHLYIREIEERTMTYDEIIREIEERARLAREEMEQLTLLMIG